MDSPSEDQAVTFFRTMVEPTVTEFMAHPADPRRGSLACIALAAQFEHTLAADGQLNGSELRRLIAEVKAEYWAAWGMREAANAFKHVKRDRDGRWGFGDFSIQDTRQCGILRAGWSPSGLTVLVGANNEWPLFQLVDAAAGYWHQRLGIAEPQPA